MFIKPKQVKVSLPDGSFLINPLVNVSLCKYIALTTFEHKVNNVNTTFIHDTITLPSIEFKGCDISWVFENMEQAKEAYQQLTKDLT